VMRGCNRSVMAGRARLSSARRAAIGGVRRRAEDRRALPPAVTEAIQSEEEFSVLTRGRRGMVEAIARLHKRELIELNEITAI